MLSASLVAAPIRQVVGEIGRLSGADVQGIAALDDERVSTSFVDLPLASALERVLGARSFALVVAAEGGIARPSRIVILPRDRGDAPPAAEPTAAPRPEISVARDDATRVEAEPAVRLEAVSRLAVMAEHDPDARVILAQISAGDADEAVRQAAREALDAGTVGTEPGGRGRRSRSQVAASRRAW